MTAPRVFSLSTHARYRCRHAGACCTAGWQIPVDETRRALLGADVLIPDAAGACTFYDQTTGLCRVHRDHGPGMLPVSCHQFPRVSLTDDRGTFVTLSHFCPTAAALLFEPVPLSIVADPEGFPPDRIYDGLDARGEWPPLVRPDLLFDLHSYGCWEAFVVSVLADDVTVDLALGRVAAAAERLREWTTGCGPFAEWTETSLANRTALDPVANRYDRFAGPEAWDTVASFAQPETQLEKRPSHARQRSVEEAEVEWGAHAAVVRRYLAAKAFASWCAYQAKGVRTLIAELYATERVLRHEAARLSGGRSIGADLLRDAIRASDWLLVHSADRARLTKWLGEAESG